MASGAQSDVECGATVGNGCSIGAGVRVQRGEIVADASAVYRHGDAADQATGRAEHLLKVRLEVDGLCSSFLIIFPLHYNHTASYVYVHHYPFKTLKIRAYVLLSRSTLPALSSSALPWRGPGRVSCASMRAGPFRSSALE